MLTRWAIERLVRAICGKQPRYRVQLTFSNGSVRPIHGGGGPPEIDIVFKTRRAEARALYLFYAGLFDGYVGGEIDLLGERALGKLVELGRASFADPARGRAVWLAVGNPVMKLLQLLQEARQSNRDLARAKRNAIFHYGFAPEFFELMLGETVGYSEGYWPPGTETLNQAKHNNYDYVARKLALRPGMKVVEVGAGWGYMPLLMAERYGCDVTVYNPVPRQNDYMRARFARRGFASIRVVEGDHREIAREPEAYDRYVSIGVYEHIGWHGYRDWIASIAAALKPGGIGVISTTSKMFREMTEYLTLKYIFPGGHLPSLPLTLATMDQCGLTVLDVENLWPHYRRTVACWLRNLEERWPEIQRIDPATFDDRFRRIWTMYLAGTIESFGANLDLSHIVFVKGRGDPGWSRDAACAGFAVPRPHEVELYR